MKTSLVVASVVLLGAWHLSVADTPQAAKKKFDFTPPDITTLFSATELARYTKLLMDNVEEVNVEATRPELEPTIPSDWHLMPWLFTPRNTSLAPSATAANATIANPPPWAGQPRPYDR